MVTAECKLRHDELEKDMVEIKGNIKELRNDVTELKNENTAFAVELRNLCSQMSDLNKNLKWLIALMVTSLLGFFFYVIEKAIFKG